MVICFFTISSHQDLNKFDISRQCTFIVFMQVRHICTTNIKIAHKKALETFVEFLIGVYCASPYIKYRVPGNFAYVY
jgi:hypothetical protein